MRGQEDLERRDPGKRCHLWPGRRPRDHILTHPLPSWNRLRRQTGGAPGPAQGRQEMPLWNLAPWDQLRGHAQFSGSRGRPGFHSALCGVGRLTPPDR